ncbi:hypothetical protein [Amycolatopsis marina]|uniref:hypothetical protein n=1 Tax=Amycolatopsis marina TaxID=490629 RepID=UPI001FED0821|nr:hypothetical protein [Amycolatopsis marina]
MTWREWLGLAAGLLALGSLFLPWTVLGAANPDLIAALAELPQDDVVRDVWKAGFFAWFPALVLLLTGFAVALTGQIRAVRVAGLPQLWLVAASVALALLLIGWFTLGWQFGTEQRALLEEAGIAIGTGSGRVLATVAAATSLLAAVLDVRAR